MSASTATTPRAARAMPTVSLALVAWTTLM
jgi:hypothetical protein